jgi:hypothetical protein
MAFMRYDSKICWSEKRNIAIVHARRQWTTTTVAAAMLLLKMAHRVYSQRAGFAIIMGCALDPQEAPALQTTLAAPARPSTSGPADSIAGTRVDFQQINGNLARRAGQNLAH